MPLHPQYRDVVATHARFLGFELVEGAIDPAGAEDLAALIDDRTSCVVVQNPSFFGPLRAFSALAEAAHAKGALQGVAVTAVVTRDHIMSPGEMGPDNDVAEGQ